MDALSSVNMSDIQAVDSTLLFHGDRWWLFANCVLNEGAPTTDELFVFAADDPLSESWVEHPQSPVVSDVSKSRPAVGVEGASRSISKTIEITVGRRQTVRSAAGIFPLSSAAAPAVICTLDFC